MHISSFPIFCFENLHCIIATYLPMKSSSSPPRKPTPSSGAPVFFLGFAFIHTSSTLGYVVVVVVVRGSNKWMYFCKKGQVSPFFSFCTISADGLLDNHLFDSLDRAKARCTHTFISNAILFSSVQIRRLNWIVRIKRKNRMYIVLFFFFFWLSKCQTSSFLALLFLPHIGWYSVFSLSIKCKV